MINDRPSEHNQEELLHVFCVALQLAISLKTDVAISIWNKIARKLVMNEIAMLGIVGKRHPKRPIQIKRSCD